LKKWTGGGNGWGERKAKKDNKEQTQKRTSYIHFLKSVRASLQPEVEKDSQTAGGDLEEQK
jgi:hypothetical protein